MVRKLRAALVVLLMAGVLVAGYAGYRLFTEEPSESTPVSRSTGTTDDGWHQVTYRGVEVEVPPDWQRLDMGGCVETSERWGPEGLDPCAPDVGLWFRASASFDPATGPGVHTAPVSKNLPDGGWTGYVTRNGVVVDVAAPDHDVVRRILRSANEVA